MQRAFYFNLPILLLIDLVELGKQLRVLRNSLVVFFGELNRSLFVDDKDSPLRHPLRPQTIILGADSAVRPKVGQHGKIDAAHLLGKSFVGKRRVNAYAQHLSVSGLEFFAVLFEVC